MRRVAAISICALATVLAGCGEDERQAARTTGTTAAAPPAPTVTVAPAKGASSFADLVAGALPAVVNVRTRGFDASRGEGSGVVIDRRGIILTNNHVVSGARTVTLSFNDGRHPRPVRGQVVGAAPERDLAIIQVDLKDLTPLPLGRSSRLRLGDGVLAIGFPLGLGGPTVTQGIVSGLDRSIRPDAGPPLEGLLQTDAAINPGNSGGALIDLSGRLVGINTAAASAGTAENVGFAIAIDEARPVIDEIRNEPPDRRAWLGASFGAVGSALQAVQLGLAPEVRGAVALTVFADSPAARGGLREGDVVVAIDGTRIRSPEDVAKATRELDPGDRVVLDVVDASGPRRLTITAGRRPATLRGR